MMSKLLTYSIKQQRRSGYLLDNYTGAGFAYSLRKIKSAYTGSCIKVRRSSDDTEQDIGFAAGNVLDESALTTFVGAGDGFVSVWYDQSGAGNNATQTTAANQPKIVSSGTVIKENTKPIIDFGLNSNIWYLVLPTGSLYNISEWSYIHVAKVKGVSGLNAGVFGPYNDYQKGLEILQHEVVSRRSLLRINYPRKNDNAAESYQLWDNDILSITSVFGSQISLYAAKNLTPVDLTDYSGVAPLNFNGVYSIGKYANNYATTCNMNGKIAELIIFEEDKRTSRSAIARSINNFYSIY